MSKYNWVLALLLVFAAAFACGCVGEDEVEEAAEGTVAAAEEAAGEAGAAAEEAVGDVEGAAKEE